MAGALPQTQLGVLTALLQTFYLDLKGLLLRGGRGGKGRGRGRGRKGKEKVKGRKGKGEGGESVPLALILQFDHWALIRRPKLSSRISF